MRRVLPLLAAVLLAPQAEAAEQVDAGVLRARITPDPWSIAFIDRAGRTALAEAPSGRLGPRKLGRPPRGRRRAELARAAGGLAKASLATLRRPFRPCGVKAYGGRLRGRRFNRRTRVLRARRSPRVAAG